MEYFCVTLALEFLNKKGRTKFGSPFFLYIDY